MLWFVSASGQVWAQALPEETGAARKEQCTSMPCTEDQEHEETEEGTGEFSEYDCADHQLAEILFRLPVHTPLPVVALPEQYRMAPPLPVSGPPPEC